MSFARPRWSGNALIELASHSTREVILTAELRHELQLLGVELHGLEHPHVRVDSLVEPPRVAPAGLHLQREGGDLGGASVYLQPEEVVLEDHLGDVLLGPALLLVHGEELVEGVHEDVARAAGRV